MRPAEIGRKLQAISQDVLGLKSKIRDLERSFAHLRDRPNHDPMEAVEPEHQPRNEVNRPSSFSNFISKIFHTRVATRNAENATKTPKYKVVVDVLTLFLLFSAALP